MIILSMLNQYPILMTNHQVLQPYPLFFAFQMLPLSVVLAHPCGELFQGEPAIMAPERGSQGVTGMAQAVPFPDWNCPRRVAFTGTRSEFEQLFSCQCHSEETLTHPKFAV